MDQQVLSVELESQICAFATFKSIYESTADAFYFEAARGIHEPPAVTVIGVAPFERLSGPAFAALRNSGEVHRGVCEDGEIPYLGGGIFGCVSYDSIAELEPKLRNQGTFEAGAVDTNALYFAKNLIVFDHQKAKIHFLGSAVGFSSSLCPKDHAQIVVKELPSERLSASLGREKFFSGVKNLKEHIRNGDIFQAVLSERFECRSSASAIGIYTALRKISPTPYSFFFKFDNREFFGASPEALLKVENGSMRTHPIAGTRPRGADDKQDQLMKRQLIESRKEAAEHLMLVDLARNDLGRVARYGTVRVNYFRSVKKFSNVMHLVSEVDAEISDESSAVEAFAACFPAGTLSGAPKFRAMEILSRIEKIPRGFYGGAVIAFDPRAQKLESCIAIRSLEICQGQAILRAGAGIVADSKPEFEYEEISHKLKPIRQAIASAEQNQ